MGKKVKSKKGKGDGGPKDPKLPKIVDGLAPSEMSRGQLMGHVVRLQAEMDKEREERNYYMLERQKIFQLWNLVLEQIAIEKERAALFAAHMQDAEKEKEAEDEIYNTKLRYLKQEQTRKLGQVRLYHLTLMKHIQDDAWAVQMVMRECLTTKKRELRKLQMAYFQILQGLYWKHAKNISDIRANFAYEIRRLETQFDRRLFENNEKLEEVQAKELAKLADTKEGQMHKLIESHRYQIKELQRFFRDMIRHNLTLIYGMKEAAKKQKTFELRAKKDYEGFKDKYDKYVASALKWKEDMELWEEEHKDDDLEELLEILKVANEEVKRLRHNQRMIECSNETIRQRLIIGNKERVALRQEFGRAVVDVQKRTSMNRFVNQMKKRAAMRETVMYEALAENVERDPKDEFDYFMDLAGNKTQEIEDLKMTIMEHATEHKNTEDSYKEAFVNNEINVADIGFPIKKTGARPLIPEEDIFNTGVVNESERLSKNKSLREIRSKQALRKKSKVAVSVASTASTITTNGSHGYLY